VIYDVYGAENLSRVMARYSVAPVIAILVAPLIGGAISDNYDWRSIFVCLFILAAVLIVMVMVWLPDIGTDREPRRSDAGVEMVTGRWTDLLGSPTFWGYATQSMFHFGTAFAFVAAGPYLMVNVLGYTASDFGIGMLVIVASMLAGVLSAERTTAFMSQPMHVVVGCLISVIGSGASALLLIGLGYPLTIYNLFAPTCIVAYGIGFAMPASQAGIVGDIPQCSATASGVSSCMQLLTAAVFAHLVTLSVYPSEMLLSITALIALVTAGAASLIPVRFARPPGY
jgi:DHA1 family bicyclomycin/chloramphenicol resistance-like MFS transporter